MQYQYDVVSTISSSSLFMYMLFGLLSLATHQGDALVMEELNTVNKPAQPMVSDSGRPLGHWAKLLKMSPTHKKMVG